MATNLATNTLLDSMEWAKKMNFNRPSAIGNSLEPALTSANIVKQTILGAPFSWWWNSFATTFTCSAGIQDYVVNTPNFAWIENSAVQDPGTTNQRQLSVKMSLAIDSVAQASRPTFISPLNQDTSTGDVTFRLMPVPDKPYIVNQLVQQSPTLFANLSDVWGPIPDYLSYIYNWGFLSMMWMFADDPRWAMANQKFIAHLLGAAQGLEETEKNIFLNNWNGITPAQNIAIQQGYQARGT